MTRARMPALLLAWYIGLLAALSIAPAEPRIWYGQNVLPMALVFTLVATWRRFPLSLPSYALITVWLTLHTIGVHYTYPKVPLGFWIEPWFGFHRNHYDRIVHFAFGLLLTYPLLDAFRRAGIVSRRLLAYLAVMTILGVSALWEIFEAWLGQIAHAEIEKAFVGHQGDVWDPQRDMASALYGSVTAMLVLSLARRVVPSVGRADAYPLVADRRSAE